MRKLVIVLIAFTLFLTPLILAENQTNSTINETNFEENITSLNIPTLYYCPQSDGYVGEISDDEIHDSGSTGMGDSLEIYCRDNVIRLCLSWEPCPWRGDIDSNNDATCSGDYGDSPMAFSANENGIDIMKLIGTGSERIEKIYCNSEAYDYSRGWDVFLKESDSEPPSSSGSSTGSSSSSGGGDWGCNNGCKHEGSCVPFGYRLIKDNIEKYCDISGNLIDQKVVNTSCQNDFECLSGQCGNGICYNIQEQVNQIESKVDEGNSLLNKIANFLKSLFGFE